jgi:DNA (cytosine-5)-methyltransferase 1
MSRPRLLDLFCGAGGCSVGYSRAGFHVTGVDKQYHPRHPGNSVFSGDDFRFVQSDALQYLAEHGHMFDAVHASPPCQAFCALKGMPFAKRHEDLVDATRQLLRSSGKPYVIENVPGAPLINPAMLCGTMFALRTDCGADLRRHRLFETNWPLVVDLKCRHYEGGRRSSIGVHGHGGTSTRDGKTISVHGDHARLGNACSQRKAMLSVFGGKTRIKRTICVNGTGLPLSGGRTITVTGSTPQQNVVTNIIRETFSVDAARTAMGIDWMVMRELSQAIPPAYTEYIGLRLMEVLR